MSEKKHVKTIAEMLEGVQTTDTANVPSTGDALREDTAPIPAPFETQKEVSVTLPADVSATRSEEELSQEASASSNDEREREEGFRTRPWIMPDPPEPEEEAAHIEKQETDRITVPDSVADLDDAEEAVEDDFTPVTEVCDAETSDNEPETGDRPVALVSHLSKRIAGKVVLEDVNLALFNGHVLGLLGPNGSGKTTLLRILAGLAHPSSGRVEIDGIVPGTETKAMVSYLPDMLFLGQEMTIESARRYFQTFFMDFDRDRFEELAARFHLPDRTKVSKMSKGYRDRLAVALVMSRRARLYLLDEPLGGVDPVVRDEILDLLVEALGDEATMLITTHQVRDLERIFDEVCFLQEGKIARYGVAEEIRNEEGADLDHVYRTIFG